MTLTTMLSSVPRCQTDQKGKTQFANPEDMLMPSVILWPRKAQNLPNGRRSNSTYHCTKLENNKRVDRIFKEEAREVRKNDCLVQLSPHQLAIKEIPLQKESVKKHPTSKRLEWARLAASGDVDMEIVMIDDKGNTNIARSEKMKTQLPSVDKVIVNKRDETNSKLRNIYKIPFCSTIQVITIFLAIHSAAVSATSNRSTNSSELDIGNNIIALSNQHTRVFEVKDRTVAQHSDTPIENVGFTLLSDNLPTLSDITISTEDPKDRIFTSALRTKMETLKNKIDKLIIELTRDNDTQRSKRSAAISENASGTFRRPNPTSAITRLDNEIRKMKEDIEQLKKIIGTENKTLLALQTTVETLAKILDDLIRDSDNKNAILESRIPSLIEVINELRNELHSIRSKVEEQERVGKQNRLPAECIEAIKRHDFATAENKFQEIDDNSKIDLIIKDVYNSQAGNFDLVLRFGDTFTDGAQNIKVFLIYKALSYEMEINGNVDSFKVAKLIESLETRIIKQKGTLHDIKTQAHSLVCKLVAWLTEQSNKPLIDKAFSNFEESESCNQNHLHNAAAKGCLDLVKYLINAKRVNANIQNNCSRTPLHYAAFNGHLDVLKYLINEKHAYVNIKGNRRSSPLHYAAFNGHLDVVKYLVNEKNVDVNIKDSSRRSPLHYAALNGQLDVVQYLVNERNVDVNIEDENRRSPLHYAALNGHLDVVKYLVNEKNVDVNIKDKEGLQPLHLAASNGHLDVVKYLVNEKNVDVNIKDKEGLQPLHSAAWNGHLDIVKYLINEKNVDASVRNNHDDSPLHLAAWKGHLDVVKYLVNVKNVDVNIRGNYGENSLHLAAGFCHLDVVKYLVNEKHVDVNVKDSFGNTPVAFAKWVACLDVVEYLTSKGAVL